MIYLNAQRNRTIPVSPGIRAILTITLLMTLSFTVTARAKAEAKASNDTDIGIQFGVAPSLFFSFNDFCQRDDDVVDCSKGMVMLGFQADALYRFPFQWLAVGVVGGMNFELNHSETCSSDGHCESQGNARLFRAALEVRGYPLIRARLHLWLALEGGMVGASGRAFSDVAPETGLGLGLDVPIGRHFLIGFDVRELFFGFGKQPATPPDGEKIQMTNAFWTTVSLVKVGARF